MDNLQTGAFIRELRKDKGLTQKDLAGQLHITDRAVSKWERGLCAPDLATLEPLAEILGVTVTELIAGKRMEETPTEKRSRKTCTIPFNIRKRSCVKRPGHFEKPI